MGGPWEPRHLIEVCLVGLLSVVTQPPTQLRWVDSYALFKSHRTNGLHAK